MNQFRVLHVLPWVIGGGVERRRALFAELQSPEFDVLILCFGARGPLLERIQRSSASLVSLGGAELREVRTWRAVVAEIRRFRPHIIHGAVFEGNILAATLGRTLGVPIVLIEETSLAIHRSPRGHFLFRSLAALSDRVVAIAPQVKAFLMERAGVPESKITTITNGVEPLAQTTMAARLAARERWGLRPTAFVWGTLSRLVDDDNKRVSDVLKALALVRRRGLDVQLLVCGDGRERPMLEALADELGVSEDVVFAGNIIAEEGLAAMDVLVHAASHEGFGLAIAEASFTGLPIVTTGVGGIAEIVIPEETGIFVPVGDPDAIARACSRLMEDSSLRLSLGEAGRSRALERFSADRYVRDLESLYRELLQEKGLL